MPPLPHRGIPPACGGICPLCPVGASPPQAGGIEGGRFGPRIIRAGRTDGPNDAVFYHRLERGANDWGDCAPAGVTNSAGMGWLSSAVAKVTHKPTVTYRMSRRRSSLPSGVAFPRGMGSLPTRHGIAYVGGRRQATPQGSPWIRVASSERTTVRVVEEPIAMRYGQKAGTVVPLSVFTPLIRVGPPTKAETH